ncbi:MAG TPA: hypothetical protein VM865_06970 [Acidobacteriaceae bacterium]|jgi:predicted transcriptional regulator|nr:hypothetical protein [Acidobacteriaceae bacterium]
MELRLTRTQEQQLRQLAADSRRTPEELACEAIKGYLDHVEELTAEVREAEEAAERQGWLTNEEVFDQLKTHLLKTA